MFDVKEVLVRIILRQNFWMGAQCKLLVSVSFGKQESQELHVCG